jgi:hypothetical protein
MRRAGPSQASNSAPPGGSEAGEPDGPPRGRARECEARTPSGKPRAWGAQTSDPASTSAEAGRHAWRALADELDRWHAAGLRATLWWRDDDAAADSPALRRLLGIVLQHRVPLAVAVIPAVADATLVAALAPCDLATVLQHGYAHANHAPPGERSAELGGHRVLAARVDELRRGHARLRELFADRFAPVLVPPWNRIATDLPPRLWEAGFTGLSCFGPRQARVPAAGLVQVNAHVDPIAWRRDRQFVGIDAVILRLVAHLAARRTADADVDEPTGLLTHHRVCGDEAFDCIGELVARTCAHPAAAWVDARRAFASAARRVLS